MNRMNVLTTAALFLCAAGLFAATIEFRKMSAALEEERGARAATAPSAAATPSTAPASEIVTEVTRLRTEMEEIRESHAQGAETPGCAMPPVARLASVDKEAVTAAVQEALDARERAAQEKQVRLMQKQQEVQAKRAADRLAKQLDLTTAQTASVAKIYLEQWTKQREAQAAAMENPDAEPWDYAKSQEELKSRVREFLTPEQASKWDEIVKPGNKLRGTKEAEVGSLEARQAVG